jgi:hypothetical protein
MPEKRVPFANTPTFYTALGLFYAAWSRTELAIDCATWKAVGTESAEQAHERSAEMWFSDKCKQLRTLLDDGKNPKLREGESSTCTDRKLRAQCLRTFVLGVRRALGDLHSSKGGAWEVSSDGVQNFSRGLHRSRAELRSAFIRVRTSSWTVTQGSGRLRRDGGAFGSARGTIIRSEKLAQGVIMV